MQKVEKETIGMLRALHQKQVQLVMIADQKANMLLGIVVVALSMFVFNFAFEFQSEILKLLFFLFCAIELFAVILCILVVSPRIGSKSSYKKLEDMENPLFFRHFSNFNRDDYVAFIIENIENPRKVFELIIADYYDLGIGLEKKYSLLKSAYIVALVGLLPIIFLIFYGGSNIKL
tara:strand:- start:118 stop:645 length:528 start_codon:yes stop_codon:yes gene_type:complete